MDFDHFLLLREESGGLEALGEATATGVLSVGAELLLNPKELVVFGQALRTGRSSGLNLSTQHCQQTFEERKESRGRRMSVQKSECGTVVEVEVA